MSEVLYRKWRPQRLDQLLGQDGITRTLRNAITQNRIAHAYLFCGPRGTGKTSTARILSKSVNCLAPDNGEPDNKCTTCRSANDGRSMDIIEIDGASNRGIDDIRNLRDKIGFSPTESRYKTYIIDEVHMLTYAACNALLKTQEEPPPHAIFVLATTESHKVPLTIISRCQRFDFRRIPLQISSSRLSDICREEGIEVTAEALSLIARASAGSLRDAQNLLERAIVSYGHTIDETQIRDMLNLGSEQRAVGFVGHIIDKNRKDGLIVINEISGDGIDLRQFHHGIMECLRVMLLLKSGAEILSGYTKEIQSEISNLAERISLIDLVKISKIFADIDMTRDGNSPIPLEIATLESILDLPMSDDSPRTEPTNETDGSKSQKVTLSEPPSTEPVTKPVIADELIKPVDSTQKSGPLEHQANEPHTGFEAQWGNLLRSLRGHKGKRFDLSALLRSSTEQEVEDGVVTLRYTHKSHQERIEEELRDPQTKRMMEEKIAEAFGNHHDIKIAVSNNQSNGEPNSQRNSALLQAARAMGATLIHEKQEITDDEQKDD